MDQDQIAAIFRQQELQRRRTRMVKLMQNEATLASEPLDEAAQKAHATAVKTVRESQLRLEKELTPGYWRRLWRALLGM